MTKTKLHSATEELLEQWNGLVDSSEHGTLYHYLDWLQAMATHTKTQFFPLIIYRGKDIAGLFPVFLKRTAFIKLVFSPPPGCAVPYLGPLYLPQKLKRKDLESFQIEVMQAFNKFCDQYKVDYVKINTIPNLTDIRPFLWSGFSAKAQYEYKIHVIQTEKEILASFQSETRTKIRRAQKDDDLEIVENSKDGYMEIYRLISKRYREQRLNWLVSDDYIRRLLKSSIAGNFHSFTAQYHGEAITGILTFRYQNTIHEWLGGIKPAQQISGVNELLHWKITQSAKALNCRWHDLGGANTPHLSRPKSKYSPELFLYFEFKKKNLKSSIFDLLIQMGMIKTLYSRLRKLK